jgi:hypothetical protein
MGIPSREEYGVSILPIGLYVTGSIAIPLGQCLAKEMIVTSLGKWLISMKALHG